MSLKIGDKVKVIVNDDPDCGECNFLCLGKIGEIEYTYIDEETGRTCYGVEFGSEGCSYTEDELELV